MFISTRDNSEKIHASEAIARGMVPGGGLYLPEAFPYFNLDVLRLHLDDSYQALATWLLSALLDDFTENEVAACVDAAYNEQSFASKDIAPLVKLTKHQYILELWHGPTAAFKDMALQIMPHLLVSALRKSGVQKKVVILVATSGDTGKAALEGFKNVEGTEIIVFYPHNGVSHMQEMQMLTTEGDNTHVVAVQGNFDDCQTAVKDMFANEALAQDLDALGFQFSSANSINWGRLAPQVVYYFSAYFKLVQREQIELGDVIDVAVPTGNFGNIFAAWIAKEMGLPIKRFICASNINHVLTDFFQTGRYDTNRDFYRTSSPSIDILVSSNLERYLYLKTGKDGAQVAQWMKSLRENGRFEVSAEVLAAIQEEMVVAYCDEDITAQVIRDTFNDTHYLLDTHTAVAVYAANAVGEERNTVIDATAHPFKFVEAVSAALGEDVHEEDDPVALMENLAKVANTGPHRALSSLGQIGERPHPVIEKDQIADTILSILKEKT